MKKLSVYILVFLQSLFCYGQKADIVMQGRISNYANEPVYIYKAYGDTLLLVDTLMTDGVGRFGLSRQKLTDKNSLKSSASKGLYRVNLKNNQWFYVLYDGLQVELKTQYDPRTRYNIATDSLKVIQSAENKLFYEFQRQQQQINVADYFLKQMMRLYPLSDPFHANLEKEYAGRYTSQDAFIAKHQVNKQSMAVKIAKAYYEPLVPDWKQPDYWRDSIKSLHYFDHFNPADSLYMHTNILPEKMDTYILLRTNKVDAYGRPVKNEAVAAAAVQEFLSKTRDNAVNFNFCFNYLLKKLKKDHQDDAFLQVYDAFAKPVEGDCGQSQASAVNAWRDRVNILRNVQIGNPAPDFELEKGKLWLSGLESKYTLLVFWATWCPHCTEVLPQVKNTVSEYNARNGGSLTTVAVSLDTEAEAWQKYVQEQKLFQFLNFSELKGWKSEVAKKYNVYATPTMILLDKDKKIIAKPETEQQLNGLLSKLN